MCLPPSIVPPSRESKSRKLRQVTKAPIEMIVGNLADRQFQQQVSLKHLLPSGFVLRDVRIRLQVLTLVKFKSSRSRFPFSQLASCLLLSLPSRFRDLDATLQLLKRLHHDIVQIVWQRRWHFWISRLRSDFANNCTILFLLEARTWLPNLKHVKHKRSYCCDRSIAPATEVSASQVFAVRQVGC